MLRKSVPCAIRILGRDFQKIEHVPALLKVLEKQKTNFQIKSNFATHTTLEESEEKNAGVLKKFLKKVGWVENSKTRLKMSSYMLYETVADGINYAQFFDECNLPNTFNSWFLITELHVWMLIVRAMNEGAESGENGRFIRNCIVEAMWADVNTRAKKLGAHNPSGTRRQIQVLAQQFQAALITYDEGIMSDDKVLAGALWRRFFEKQCEDYEILENLVKYVREQVNILDSTKREQFIIKPQITWLPLKVQ